MQAGTLYTSLINPDGTVKDKVGLQLLLLDYLELKENSRKVYETITGGLLNKSHYKADTVISVYNALQKQLVDKDMACEDIVSIVGEHTELSELIKEYFGKN